MATISVHTVVSSNSIKYFKYLVENYTKKKSSDSELIFYAHCTDNSAALSTKYPWSRLSYNHLKKIIIEENVWIATNTTINY